VTPEVIKANLHPLDPVLRNKKTKIKKEVIKYPIFSKSKAKTSNESKTKLTLQKLIVLRSVFNVSFLSPFLKRDRTNEYEDISNRKSPMRKGIRPGPGVRNSPKPN
jgi:hypothetical protein